MSNSLRDQLMGLGFKAPAPEPKRERPARDARPGGKPSGKPGEARKKPEATKFKCTCGKPLVRRESAKGPFFGCSGYPGCKKLFQVGEDGRPIIDAKKGGKK